MTLSRNLTRLAQQHRVARLRGNALGARDDRGVDGIPEAGNDDGKREGAPSDEAKLTGLAQLGVSRAVLGMPQGPGDEVLAELDRVAPLVEALRDA